MWWGRGDLNLFDFGDEVTVAMPRGVSKRGIPGISVLYTTWPEARFDGAAGTVIGIDPRSTYGIPLYLVDFSRTRIASQSPGSGNGSGESGSCRRESAHRNRSPPRAHSDGRRPAPANDAPKSQHNYPRRHSTRVARRSRGIAPAPLHIDALR